MRALVAVAALMLLAGCGAPPAKPEVRASAGVNFRAEAALLDALPAAIAGFERRGPAEPDPTPGMVTGALTRFARQGAFATLYLFNRGTTTVPEGPASPQAMAELRDTLLAASVSLARVSPTPLAWQHFTIGNRQGQRSGGPELACARGVLTLPTGPRIEMACVTGLDGRMFKIRITAMPAAGQETAVQIVLDSLAGQMRDALAGVRPTVRA